MDKKDPDIRVFEGDKFPVWKYYMEICFADKDVMCIVNGTVPKPPDDASDAEQTAWYKADAQARRMIRSSVSLPVLENLVNCPTAACMWATLCAFYQQKSRENIYMLQNSFFEYKMRAGDSINTHIYKVLSMGNLLKDLGHPVHEEMLITKIMCSLPPCYNNIVTAWNNVPALEQTVANLKVRLLQLENILSLQGGESSGDSAFFTRSSKPTSKHRDKVKFPNQKKHQSDRQRKDTRGRRSEACTVTTEPANSGSSNHSSESDDSCTFMVISRRSHALSVNLDKQAWFADSSATEHMTEHRDWFSTFRPIATGTWSVTVADDRDLWVQGVGDINITRLVDGVQKKGVLQKVLFIPDLRRNLFSIGFASKAGLSFQTLGDKCVLYKDLGEGPKVMEGVQVGTLYKLSITGSRT